MGKCLVTDGEVAKALLKAGFDVGKDLAGDALGILPILLVTPEQDSDGNYKCGVDALLAGGESSAKIIGDVLTRIYKSNSCAYQQAHPKIVDAMKYILEHGSTQNVDHLSGKALEFEAKLVRQAIKLRVANVAHVFEKGLKAAGRAHLIYSVGTEISKAMNEALDKCKEKCDKDTSCPTGAGNKGSSAGKK